ncbi:hypothetical protein FACS1894152_1590 [Bacilli bacterium]|nr:hypothetical protein FACS1894152_1590 [Bacilli bacterium]
MAKFGRKYLLKIQDRQGKIWQMDKFNIDFSVTKNINGNSNGGKITIRNLEEETRNLFLKDRMANSSKDMRYCSLSTGYGDQPLNLILSGSIFECHSSRSGVDVNTDIQVIDGFNFYQNGFMNKPYSRGTAKSVIVADIVKEAKKYGLTVGQVDNIEGTLDNKLTINSELRQIKLDGYNIFVENEQLNIIRTGGHIKAKALLISSETGLLDVPTRYDSYIEVTIDLLQNSLLQRISRRFGSEHRRCTFLQVRSETTNRRRNSQQK